MFATFALDHRFSDEGIEMQQRCLRASGAFIEPVFVAEGLQFVLDESAHAS